MEEDPSVSYTSYSKALGLPLWNLAVMHDWQRGPRVMMANHGMLSLPWWCWPILSYFHPSGALLQAILLPFTLNRQASLVASPLLFLAWFQTSVFHCQEFMRGWRGQCVHSVS